MSKALVLPQSIFWAAVGVLLARAPLSAQSISGRVIEERRNTPITGVVVALVDQDGRHRAEAVSDSLGAFRLSPPTSGNYVIEATRFGYERTRSPLLSLEETGTVSIDLTMVPQPISLEGFEVPVKGQAEEKLRNLGHSPSSLGLRWIDRTDIEKMPLTVHPREMIRWRGIPGVWVPEDSGGLASGLCVTFRRARTFSGAERCALILLNGAPVSPVDAQYLGRDEVEAIAILTPVDATTFYGTQGGGGVVLIWTRSGRP